MIKKHEEQEGNEDFSRNISILEPETGLIVTTEIIVQNLESIFEKFVGQAAEARMSLCLMWRFR